MSCLLKHFIRKIRINVNRAFDVSNIIFKIEVVYANVKVVIRVEDFKYLIKHSTVLLKIGCKEAPIIEPIFGLRTAVSLCHLKRSC